MLSSTAVHMGMHIIAATALCRSTCCRFYSSPHSPSLTHQESLWWQWQRASQVLGWWWVSNRARILCSNYSNGLSQWRQWHRNRLQYDSPKLQPSAIKSGQPFFFFFFVCVCARANCKHAKASLSMFVSNLNTDKVAHWSVRCHAICLQSTSVVD